MPSEVLKMTTEIVVAHAAVTALTPGQLVGEIKEVYNALAALEGREVLEEPVAAAPAEPAGPQKPGIPLKDIVKAKYVVCLECGKHFKTLKAHLRKTHGLTPKEYYARFGLDPKKFPLVCRDYSAARRQMAVDRGLGALGGRRRAKKPA